MLGQLFQQGSGFPSFAMLLVQLADAIIDLFQANGVGVPHRSASISGKSVAVEINDVDVHRAQSVAFFEEARAFVDQRVEATIDDLYG